MLTSTKTKRQQVAEVAARREAAYEAYEQSLLLDELTDQSERLARPMEHGFVYSIGSDGKLYSEYGDNLEKVFADGLTEAMGNAMHDPNNWGFEVGRREIELEELHQVEALADGEKIITFSPIPDAVREGRVQINGYNRQRQKMLVRISERRDDEVTIFSFSLDGSNYQAMQLAAKAVGAEYEGLGSEEILANRFHYESDHPFNLKDCHSLIREAYDLSMERQFGGSWYAGRPEIEQGDALSFIKQQSDLISQHMDAIKNIMAKALSKDEQKHVLESARYDFAAALDDRLNGKEVGSLVDAGDTARSEGRSYDGDCATSSTASQAEQLGFNQAKKGEYKWMNCPFCGQRTYSDVCAPKCNECGSTPGNDMTKHRGSKVGGKRESMWQMLDRWYEESRLERMAKEKANKAKKLGKAAYELAG